MWKKPAVWAPPAIGLVVAIVLAFFVATLFGGEVSAYIQAASTILLVAVTASYVVATYDMADASRKQFLLARSEPSVRAVDAVVRAWARVAPQVTTTLFGGREYAARAIVAPNTESSSRDQFRDFARRTSEFGDVLSENRHLLPSDVAEAAEGLAAVIVRNRIAAEAIDEATWNEIQRTFHGSGHVASLEAVKAAWQDDHRTHIVDFPTWEEYVGNEWSEVLYDAAVAFDEATSRYFEIAEKGREA